MKGSIRQIHLGQNLHQRNHRQQDKNPDDRTAPYCPILHVGENLQRAGRRGYGPEVPFHAASNLLDTIRVSRGRHGGPKTARRDGLLDEWTGFVFFRRNDHRGRDPVARLQLQQAHTLSGAPRFADVLGLDANDLAVLADQHHF